MRKLGLIGGSGIYQIDGVKEIARHKINTPFGAPSAPVVEMDLQGHSLFFIPRHGEGHVLLPSEVPYAANIYALKKLGVNVVLSISAVGSLREDIRPGTLHIPDQFIDWTKGLRTRTFFGGGLAGHASAANPIDLNWRQMLIKSCQATGVEFGEGGSYVCIEGPQFSTRAESEFYRRGLQGSLIGMTNVPESFLAKEASMAYATLALVTDFDCWKEEACSVEEIVAVLKSNNLSAHKVIKHLVPAAYQNPVRVERLAATAVMTDPERISSAKQELFDLLLQ